MIVRMFLSYSPYRCNYYTAAKYRLLPGPAEAPGSIDNRLMKGRWQSCGPPVNLPGFAPAALRRQT